MRLQISQKRSKIIIFKIDLIIYQIQWHILIHRQILLVLCQSKNGLITLLKVNYKNKQTNKKKKYAIMYFSMTCFQKHFILIF